MSYFATKKGKFLLDFLKYGFFMLLLYLFSVGGIRNQIFPFAFGFYIALCWCNQNVFATSLVYVGASLLAVFSVQHVIITVSCALVIIACYYIHKKIKVRIPSALLVLYALLSQTAYMYYHLTSINYIVSTIVYLVIGILFMYACIKIFKVLLVKGIGLKLTIDESICYSVFFIAVASGLSAVNLWGFSPLNLACVFLILLATYVYSVSTQALVVGASFGLGYALQTGSMSMLGCFVVLALCSVAFRSTNKYFSVMAIIIGDVVLGLYFNAYGIYNYKILLSTLLGEILFLCISNKTLSLLKAVFGDKNGTVALRCMVNRSRDTLCKRMYNLSEVFAEMNRSFKDTIRGVLPAGEAKQMLKEELYQKVCADCPEKHRCHRVMAKETAETIDNIVSAGLDRGKVTILDIPPFLSTRCNRTTTILNTLNGLINNYKQYTYCVNSVDTSKSLIAEEFNGVSKLLLTLADETKDLVTFNEELENKIMEDLNYVNIMSNEVYVYQKQENMVACTITLRSIDSDNPKLFEILNKNFGTKMMLTSSEPAPLPNYVVASFNPAPKYDLIFGTSGTPKYANSVSGDSYTFVKLNKNKILLSICDGMGSGEEAQKTSDTTISLIENFYKADFDDEIILSSVNKLLSMQMTENYSAVDICVIDLKDALGDFVKVGAPQSFVKHKDSTEEIQGQGALPIGILQDIKPSISKKLLSPDDMIILCSDGITDAFASSDVLCSFINDTQTTNPQEMANIILQKAEELNDNVPKDDMTVLCARIFVNI